MDPETLMKTWVPDNLQGFEETQQTFWNQMMSSPVPGKKELGYRE